ncbi:MAG: cobalamin-binding protein [bacterium]
MFFIIHKQDELYSYERIISLAPAITEMLYSLDLGENILGVTTYCNFPEDAKSKEKIGEFSYINIEKIILLKPDLIFASGGVQEKYAKILQDLKFNIEIIYPQNIEGIFNSLERIGELTDTKRKAEKLISQSRTRLNIIKAETENIPKDERTRVFIEMWDEPLTTAGSKSFINQIISMAGGNNIADKIQYPYPRISPEFVILNDPQIILIAYNYDRKNNNLNEEVKLRPGWKNVSAVKYGRIITDFDPDILLRESLRIVDAVEKLHDLLYLKAN